MFVMQSRRNGGTDLHEIQHTDSTPVNVLARETMESESLIDK